MKNNETTEELRLRSFTPNLLDWQHAILSDKHSTQAFDAYRSKFRSLHSIPFREINSKFLEIINNLKLEEWSFLINGSSTYLKYGC